MLILAALAACCSKPSHDGAPILFSIDDGLDAEMTKAAISTGSLSSSTLKVYAKKDNVELNEMKPGLINKQIGALWTTQDPVYWDDGKSYTFQGYAYDNGITSIANDGLSFTVTQPATSSERESGFDYIISNKVDVSAELSKRHPLVNLEFDHVLPLIEIYVTKSERMKDVKVTEVTLSGLFYQADMRYSLQDKIWSPELKGNRAASYGLTGEMVASTKRDETEAAMKIISVPQGFNEETTLLVKYKVDESPDGADPNYVEYNQLFRLSDFVEGIRGGYRTVFDVYVDTGIHLKATIAEWIKIDFIEGTILPPIPVKQ